VIIKFSLLLLTSASLACTDPDLIPVKVTVGARSLSKLPFMIAKDQGLYEKHGVDVQLAMPMPQFEGGIEVQTIWIKVAETIGIQESRSDIFLNGHTPEMINRVTQASDPHWLAIAATDCVVRAHIVGRQGIDSLEDLKGKRLGISLGIRANTGMVALMLAQRMGWDPILDISIMLNGRSVSALRKGLVDAIVASEKRFAVARQEGFPILEDTQTWNEHLAGNSVLVKPGWLEKGRNREAARRFLKATIEGIALFHRQRELALQVMARWYGIRDREIAETIYDRGAWIPRKPYPCYEGIERTFEFYDSNELRRYTAEDFYDDSIMREIDESGFIEELYE
jgi:ABC-type nitrate/sulfonate/bicarbonate transport system substrate-binding protein